MTTLRGINMKTRFSLKNHLSHSFLLYIVSFLVVLLICSYAIQIKTRPKDHEKFSFFSEATLVDGSKFNNQLSKVLPEDLVIDLYDMDRNDRTFKSYLSAHGLNSDICLLSETTIAEFKTIPFLDLKETVWDSVDNYILSDLSVGIPANKEKLADIFNFNEENYYLCVIKSSVHLKGLKKGGQTDQVNRVLEYLTTYE